MPSGFIDQLDAVKRAKFTVTGYQLSDDYKPCQTRKQGVPGADLLEQLRIAQHYVKEYQAVIANLTAIVEAHEAPKQRVHFAISDRVRHADGCVGTVVEGNQTGVEQGLVRVRWDGANHLFWYGPHELTKIGHEPEQPHPFKVNDRVRKVGDRAAKGTVTGRQDDAVQVSWDGSGRHWSKPEELEY